jgi:propane monooxygenase small subunit
MGVAESDFDRDLGYTKELLIGLTRDEQYGEENRELFSRWLSEPIAMSLRAAQALAPIWSEAEHSPVSFEDTLTRARERVHEILREIHIPAPKELDQ